MSNVHHTRYAFGVIMSEVLTRTEPFFDSDFGPVDVVHMVMKGPAASQKLYTATKAAGADGDHFKVGWLRHTLGLALLSLSVVYCCCCCSL